MTNELRKLIKSQLLTLTGLNIKEVYYQVAEDGAMYPHIVFKFDGINSVPEDNNRLDYRLIVDVWTKGTNASSCENITDAVISLFKALNKPDTTILPTFFLESSMSILDEDKTIRHNQIKFTVQTYKRS